MSGAFFAVLCAASLAAQVPPAPDVAPGAPTALPERVSVDLPEGVLGADLLARPGDPVFVIAREDGLDALPWSRLARGDTRPAARLPLDGRHVLAYCVGEVRPGDRAVFAISDGGEVLRWDADERPARVLFKDPDVRLPAGVYDVPFLRDLDDDGDGDFVLPRFGGLVLWLARTEADGIAWRRGPVVRQRTDITVHMPWGLDAPSTLSQNVSISGFEVEDQNGDGHPDLAFRDRDLVQFFWSGPDGALPESPTFVLDLAEVRAGLPQNGSDVIDTSNLLRILESQVSHEAIDLDGDGAVDLMLRQGRKVSVYRGGPGGIDRSHAAQVLKTSGNLLAAFAVDDNGDGKSDLCMLRVDDISLGQVVLWAVAGGSLSFDLFSYDQEEPLRFARKPSRQRALVLSLPSIAGLISQIEEDKERLIQGFLRMPVAGDFDGDSIQDDVAELGDDGRMKLFLNVGGDHPIDRRFSRWKAVIGRFDRESGASGKVDVTLRQVIEWAPLPGRELFALVEGKRPDAEFPLAPEADRGPADASAKRPQPESEDLPVLFVLDANGDGIDDVVVARALADHGGLRLTVCPFATR